MTKQLSELDELALKSVREAVERGTWRDIPELAKLLSNRGISLLQEEEEQQIAAQRVEAGDHIDGNGWDNDITAMWRIILKANLPGSCVIYFAEEPDYATMKAFARAAGAPVNQVKAEKRPDV